MLRDAEEFAGQDREAKEKIDAKNSLYSYLHQTKSSIDEPEKLAYKVSKSDQKTVNEALKEAEDWMNESRDAEKEDFED